MSIGGGSATIPVNHPPPPIPEDAVEEILSWLPVKSITRFMSLSKRFLSIAAHPKFVDAHLHRSPLRRPSSDLLLLLPDSIPSAAGAASLFDLQSRSTIPDLVHVPNFTSHADSVRVLDSRGGLVLIALSSGFSDNKPLYVLWNPATRQFRTDLRDKLHSFVPDGSSLSGTSCGLVYDERAGGDHKLVFLNHIADVPHIPEDGSGKFEIGIQPVVFSLKQNSWREVEYGGGPRRPPPQGVICVTDKGATHVKGGLYFDVLLHPVSEGSNFMLRFDIATEGFSKVRLPESCSGKLHGTDECRDKLALFVCSRELFRVEQERLTELWLLDDDDHDQQDCWRKVYSIVGSRARMGDPLFAVGTRDEAEKMIRLVTEAIVRRDDGGGFQFVRSSISMYDPVVQEMITLIGSYSRGGQCDHQGEICKYVESLVSVHGGFIQGEPNN